MKKLKLNWVSDTIGDDFKNWKQGDTVLIQAQTGTGKTWFITNVLLDKIASYERLLYVCNRRNLKRQLKRDLLEKYGESIPKTIEELDAITTIANKVTITSYHAISNSIRDGLYGQNHNYYVSNYDYVVLDECHFILTDGSFNNKTRFAYKELVVNCHPSSIKIFISATMQEIRERIISSVEKNKSSGFGLDDLDIHEYTTGTDYSYVTPQYFMGIDSVINLIKNDGSDEKWLVFISDIERDGKRILDGLGEKTSSLIQAGTESEELDSIIHNEKFNKKVLVATKALDNGININDPKLKNIVIMAWDKTTFIQMLGRKRIDIENPDRVNLYIPKRYKKSFMSKLHNHMYKLREINLYEKDKVAFYKKYDNDLRDFNGLNDVFYRDNKTGDIKINKIGEIRLKEDIKFCEYMIDKFNKVKEYAYIKEQLSWLGLGHTFHKANDIGDVFDIEELQSLEEYLDSLIGKELRKEEQEELVNFIQLKDKRGRIQKSIKLLNAYLVENKISYQITPKRKNNYRYWQIEGNVDISKR